MSYLAIDSLTHEKTHWSDRRAALYATGLVEYYFETARTMLDLTLTQSFVKFTNIRWIFSHCGGAFPSIEDRALKLQPAIEVPAQAVYGSRYENFFC